MESKFTGRLIGLIGINIATAFIVTITLGLGTPAAICMSKRWYAKHTIIDGQQLVFDGKGGQLFGKFIVWYLLTIVTLGIYSFWLPIKMEQWVASHTHLKAAPVQAAPVQAAPEQVPAQEETIL